MNHTTQTITATAPHTTLARTRQRLGGRTAKLQPGELARALLVHDGNLAHAAEELGLHRETLASAVRSKRLLETWKKVRRVLGWHARTVAGDEP